MGDAWPLPLAKRFALEVHPRIFLRFETRELAVNFGKGFAYAMRQRDLGEACWRMYEVRAPGFRRGVEFAARLRIYARRWGLVEKWSPILLRLENGKFIKERGF